MTEGLESQVGDLRRYPRIDEIGACAEGFVHDRRQGRRHTDRFQSSAVVKGPLAEDLHSFRDRSLLHIGPGDHHGAVLGIPSCEGVGPHGCHLHPRDLRSYGDGTVLRRRPADDHQRITYHDVSDDRAVPGGLVELLHRRNGGIPSLRSSQRLDGDAVGQSADYLGPVAHEQDLLEDRAPGECPFSDGLHELRNHHDTCRGEIEGTCADVLDLVSLKGRCYVHDLGIRCSGFDPGLVRAVIAPVRPVLIRDAVGRFECGRSFRVRGAERYQTDD